MKYITILLIIIISIIISLLSYKYLITTHEKDKKIKKDFTKEKSLKIYIISLVFYVLVLIISYYLNIFAFDFTSITLMIITISLLYLIITVEAFVHSNVTVEYIKYLLRNKYDKERLTIFIINTSFTLIITYISIISFIPLLDIVITSILRIVMLSSNILSFTLVIIYKELKPYMFKNGK